LEESEYTPRFPPQRRHFFFPPGGRNTKKRVWWKEDLYNTGKGRILYSRCPLEPFPFKGAPNTPGNPKESLMVLGNSSETSLLELEFKEYGLKANWNLKVKKENQFQFSL